MPADKSFAILMDDLGARQHRGPSGMTDWYVLDQIDGEWFLAFDFETNPEDRESRFTCDIYLAKVGDSPLEESDQRLRVYKNARAHHVLRFMFALGVSRFPPDTRQAMYANYGVIRTMGEP